MAGYLSATRGPFASYGNTPHSDQFDTITAACPLCCIALRGGSHPEPRPL
jgi:hypothetical protein